MHVMLGVLVRTGLRGLVASAVAVAASALGGPAVAQPSQLQLGVATTGELPPRQPSGLTRSTAYRIALREGDSIRVDLESDDFDPGLWLFVGEGAERRMLDGDDDSGGNFNARLRHTARAEGVYELLVEESGARDGPPPPQDRARFRIVVVRDAPLPQRPTLALALGAESQVTLAPLEGEGPISSQTYTFRGEAGQRLVVQLNALQAGPSTRPVTTAFQLERPGGGATPILRHRPSPSRMLGVATLPVTGEYRLTLANRGLVAPMTFALKADAQPVVVRPPATLTVGRSVSERFSYRDAETTGAFGEEAGQAFHAWRVDGRRGQSVRVELCATAFDPALLVIGSTAVGQRVIAENDDADEGAPCGGDVNSRIDLTFVRDEVVTVLATPGRLAEGDYTLTATAIPPPAPAPAPAPASRLPALR